MTLIIWDESLSVGLSEIDSQHKKWIELINRLNEVNGYDKSKIKLILKEVVDFTEIHFKHEEIYFEKFNFSGTLGHKSEHKKFIEKILSYQIDINSGNEVLSQEVMEFIRDWVVTHVKFTDRGYVSCFRENGVR
jgi:hemerythrin